MTQTWQRIIKAGKGILEIARERELPTVDQIIVMDHGGRFEILRVKGYHFRLNNYRGDSVDELNFELSTDALNHLEEIAQAFEEALEIWRKM